MTRNPATMRQAIESIEELIVLEGQKVNLLHEMKRCLLLLELVPDVPKDGIKRTTVDNRNYGMLNHVRNMTLVVHLVDGSERRFPMLDVDQTLWPAGTIVPKELRPNH